MGFPALATFLLQTTLMVGAAMAVRRLLRDRIPAATRFRMLFLVMASIPLMALVSVFEVRLSADPAFPTPHKIEAAAFSDEPAPTPPAEGERLLPIRVPRALAAGIVAIWAAVGLFRVGALLQARRASSRLLRRLSPCRDAAWLAALRNAGDRLEIRRPIRLLDGGDLPPFTAGWLGRSIVVPSAGEDWSRERREAILLHEVAHVRRKDVLRMTYIELIAASLWCVPTTPMALRAFMEDREEACDEEAIANGVRPSDYAATLLELTVGLPPAPPLGVLGIAYRTRAEARIRRVMDRGASRTERRLLGRTATAALILAGVLVGGTGSLSRVFALEAPGSVAQVGTGAPGGDRESPVSGLPTASPLTGEWRVTQAFGQRAHPVTGKTYFHAGLDLANGRSGDLVRSTVTGTVMEAAYNDEAGNHVAVGDGRILVRFSKLQDFRVAVGERVSVGTVIGTVGATGIATGPHLHYEIWVDGVAVDPAAPLRAGGARFSGQE